MVDGCPLVVDTLLHFTSWIYLPSLFVGKVLLFVDDVMLGCLDELRDRKTIILMEGYRVNKTPNGKKGGKGKEWQVRWRHVAFCCYFHRRCMAVA